MNETSAAGDVEMVAARVRDYSLGAEAEQAAINAGLAEADWYRTSIAAPKLRLLTTRSDAPALANLGLYLALLIGSGALLYLSLWSWWTIPAVVIYGVLYGSASDPRWHECGHGTAFRTTWLNDAVYYVASFMLLRDPTVWRWSHVRHHSDTIIVGRDPEIVLERPPAFRTWALNLFNLANGPASMARTLRHALGRVAAADRSYIPERDIPKVRLEAGIYLAVWIGVGIWCAATASLVPLLFVVGPSFYGAWLVLILATTQHLGLREDVLDHRLNTRTMYLNPVLRFLYWNMNYHTEHHMYPAVPTHNLASLHDEIKSDLPEPTPSLVAAYREIVPALRAQRTDPDHQIDRVVPAPAGPTRARNSSAEQVPLNGRDRGDGVIDVCGEGDLDDGDVRRLDVGDKTYAVYRLGERYLITDGICTHSRRQHLAEGVVVGGQIECPKHLGRFDIETGEPAAEPVCVALKTYEVHRDGGRIVMARPR